MDPLAIAGFATTSAASCLKLSSLLYTYIEEVRDVDSIVSALGSDLKMLSTSLDGISTTLQEHGTNITAKLDKSAKLFKSLSICIIECDETLDAVAILLDDAQKHGGSLLTLASARS
ncbi:hypothetical protein BDW59DRAFT_141421 [Aspergillus cavernicola]|uniref:Fungal N-terminal domain-containing protein n=1 Tax=Aspergillus cavernicola TaxID=176166 RepID=A0ABR4ITX1_9EURO